MSDVKSKSTQELLESEKDFFDRESADLKDESLALKPHTIERYRNARPKIGNFSKDNLFAKIMPLEGKRVLDYGCGAGENACLLAACGAEVWGFDLSPVSIDKAKRRAELMGLADRTHFDVYAAGQTNYANGQFDMVICFAILHHLHMMLDTVYREIERITRPGGSYYAIEPVANHAIVRKLRKVFPVELIATPDERQLFNPELEKIQQFGFSNVEFMYSLFLERFYRVFGENTQRPLRKLDDRIERMLPFLRPLYGMVLVSAVKKERA
jgi:2-polyprenyl-3-methyl-5-hydroxy-6-metoxy-1,4-benzoquinol methylase